MGLGRVGGVERGESTACGRAGGKESGEARAGSLRTGGGGVAQGQSRAAILDLLGFRLCERLCSAVFWPSGGSLPKLYLRSALLTPCGPLCNRKSGRAGPGKCISRSIVLRGVPTPLCYAPQLEGCRSKRPRPASSRFPWACKDQFPLPPNRTNPASTH